MKSISYYLSKLKPENTSGYAYTNTRVRVMKTKLLTKADYEKLMKMDLNEIIRFLQESEYKKEIDELATEFSKLNLLEYSITRNLEKTFSKIHSFSIKSSYEQVKLFLEKYDIWNIKTIIRGKYTKAPAKEIKNNLIAVGTLKRERLEKIIDKTTTIDEVINELKDTKYFEVLEKNKNNISKLEDELDKKYYSELISLGQADLKAFALKEIKMINTLNSIRAKQINVKIELLPGTQELIVIPKEFEGKEEAYLKQITFKDHLKMLHKFKATIAPLLAYFIAKEKEIANLRMIARGKHAGLPEETIRENLIIA